MAAAEPERGPRPAPVIRAVVGTGAVLLLAAPFVSDGVAYLEGRASKPFLFADVWLDLFWLAVAFATFATVLLSRTLFPESRRLLRFAAAFGFLFGAPVYYFAVATPPAALYLRGMASTAKRQVDLTALQEWAAQTLRRPHPELKASTNNPAPHAPLNWSDAPADARAYLDGPEHEALVESESNGQECVALIGAWDRVLVAGETNLSVATNRYWCCRLASGVYLQHRVRP